MKLLFVNLRVVVLKSDYPSVISDLEQPIVLCCAVLLALGSDFWFDEGAVNL